MHYAMANNYAQNYIFTDVTELADGIRLAYEDFLTNPMRAER